MSSIWTAKRRIIYHRSLSQKQPVFQLVLLEQKDVYVEASKSTACGNAWRGRQFPLPSSLAVQHPRSTVFSLLPVTTWGHARCEGVTAGGSALAWRGLLG